MFFTQEDRKSLDQSFAKLNMIESKLEIMIKNENYVSDQYKEKLDNLYNSMCGLHGSLTQMANYVRSLDESIVHMANQINKLNEKNGIKPTKPTKPKKEPKKKK